MSSPLNFIRPTLATILIFVLSSLAWCQEDGSDDLDQAFSKKVTAQTTKDRLDVAKLCKSAIKKGLDEEGETQAKQLAATSFYEYSDQLSQRIFASHGRDKRWRIYRRQALKRLNEAVELQPNMVDAFLLIARLETLPGGDETNAKEAINKAIELASDDREQLSEALLMRARLSDDEETQLSDLNQAIKIAPKNLEAVRLRGLYYLTKDEYEKAIADLDRWIEAGKPNTNDSIEVVVALLAKGEKNPTLQDEALKVLDKAIKNDLKNRAIYLVRAQLHLAQKKLDEAANDVSQALELKPDDLGALLMRASIYSDQEKNEKALADVNRVLTQMPLNARAIQLRSMILARLERYEEAIEDVQLLAQSNPGEEFFQRQLAILYNASDQPKKAIPIYDRLVRANSPKKWEGLDNAEKLPLIARRIAALQGRADARLSTGEHKLAVKDYEEALELDIELRRIEKEEKVENPSKPDDGILNNLAWVLATSTDDDVRNGERAVELATEAAEVTEFKQAHILSTLGAAYAEIGDFENAIKWSKKALEQNRIAEEEKPSKRNREQRKSLQKELDNYLAGKPVRENQWEELQAKKAKAKKAKEEGDKKEDGDQDDAKKENNPKGDADQGDDAPKQEADNDNDKKENEKGDTEKGSDAPDQDADNGNNGDSQKDDAPKTENKNLNDDTPPATGDNPDAKSTDGDADPPHNESSDPPQKDSDH